MRTKRLSETQVACGRQALLDELGISEGSRRAVTERTGYGCGCPECAAMQWNTQRLEHWICGRLTAAGADEAEVDARIDDIPVDLYWRRGDRRCVVEVRSGPLDITAARAHRKRLQAAGIDDVLWVCPQGFWVPLVPAVGIADFAPAAADYRVAQGMLAAGETGFAAPASRQHGVAGCPRRLGVRRNPLGARRSQDRRVGRRGHLGTAHRGTGRDDRAPAHGVA